MLAAGDLAFFFGGGAAIWTNLDYIYLLIVPVVKQSLHKKEAKEARKSLKIKSHVHHSLPPQLSQHLRSKAKELRSLLN